MCPVSLSGKFVFILKSLECFFIAWVLVGIAHLAKPKYFFDCMIKNANWLIALHGFEGTIKGTDKAFNQFRRDWLLLVVLNSIILVLLQLI